jgi:hypothetical protein
MQAYTPSFFLSIENSPIYDKSGKHIQLFYLYLFNYIRRCGVVNRQPLMRGMQGTGATNGNIGVDGRNKKGAAESRPFIVACKVITPCGF